MIVIALIEKLFCKRPELAPHLPVLRNCWVSRVRQNHFVPDVCAVLVEKVRAERFKVGVFFIHPSLGDLAHADALLDVDDTYMLWSPA